MRKIIVFDTTLRDGEQSPGFSMNVAEKVSLAEQLSQLGVDVIEGGFPIASNDDFEAVRQVAKAVNNRATVAALCRTKDQDLDRAAEALKGVGRSRIHTFIATSDLHLQHKLKMTRDEVIDTAVAAVKRARKYTNDVEFSAEDATRSDRDYLCRVVEAVIKAGATTVNLPDTVGHTIPWEYSAIIKDVLTRVPGASNIVISVHCHNDLGLAVANSLEAIRAGAGQVECTINGIGERAGNAALEEIVMALKHRHADFDAETGVRTEEIIPTSSMLVEITGVPVQPNKAVVGSNAFAHESGIHQHGMLSHEKTYEILRPESVGANSRLHLGKHSGRHAFRRKLVDLDVDLDEAAFEAAFLKFKELCDRVKNVTDDDILQLVGSNTEAVHAGPFILEHLQFTSGTDIVSHATVTMKVYEETVIRSAWAYGPIEAACKAIDQACSMTGKLLDYTVKATSAGKDAVGEVRVTVEHENRKAEGRASSVNVVEASARAYAQALIKLAKMTGKIAAGK
ncbi:MAG TPA: 2-isopropylmalate synthase [Planctomycetota bacterium]|nr:2-isopropylmalate synthase [Planctomycetota bacterium]